MSGLEVSRVRLTAGGRLIADDVDMTAPARSVTALVGPNGAGKSTLLRAIVQAVPGTMLLDGTDLVAMPRRERARRVAIVEQESPALPGMSVRDVVELGRLPHRGLFGADDSDAVDEALLRSGASALSERVVDTINSGKVHIEEVDGCDEVVIEEADPS